MKSYYNNDIQVNFDKNLCIHAQECVKGLPNVFNLSKRPWVNVDNDSVDSITDTIMQCPSGALTFKRSDGLKEIYKENEIRFGKDGEMYIKGDFTIYDNGEKIRVNRAVLKPNEESIYYNESLTKYKNGTKYYK